MGKERLNDSTKGLLLPGQVRMSCTPLLPPKREDSLCQHSGSCFGSRASGGCQTRAHYVHGAACFFSHTKRAAAVLRAGLMPVRFKLPCKQARWDWSSQTVPRTASRHGVVSKCKCLEGGTTPFRTVTRSTCGSGGASWGPSFMRRKTSASQNANEKHLLISAISIRSSVVAFIMCPSGVREARPGSGLESPVGAGGLSVFTAQKLHPSFMQRTGMSLAVPPIV